MNRTEAGAPTVPIGSVWRTVRGFILWSYERGTIQYDVMVTLILLFVFYSPKLINFKDRPVERNPYSTGVVVYPNSTGGLVYEVDAKAIHPGDDSKVQAQLLSIIEPISGEVSIVSYQTVPDKKGRVVSYKVTVYR